MSTTSQFTNLDTILISTAGLTAKEVGHQLQLLEQAIPSVVLDRPCTRGDGICELSEATVQKLVRIHQNSARDGRWVKFVPASGAASRMFRIKNATDQNLLCQQEHMLAFCDQLSDLVDLAMNADYEELEDAMLNGLGFANTPKGLIPFHRYESDIRTPFEEHMLEASKCFQTEAGSCDLHFTVSPEHQERFSDLLVAFQDRYRDIKYRVSFSVQQSSTDTLALGQDGVVRKPNGQILLRPGGHGALIRNLNQLNADCVFIKNIDNVCHESQSSASEEWIQALCGYLIRFQRRAHNHLIRLESITEINVSNAEEFIATHLRGASIDPSASLSKRRDTAYAILNRPIRVCGMVVNEGEPGGGPFWQRHTDGSSSVQIVESVEVNTADCEQTEVARQATHFNPVFMALGVRDHRGNNYDLAQFIDQDRYILNEKNVDGTNARVLEHPGLWNGSMAKWNSIFIEVPVEVFTPAKTVVDLLRDTHQPA